MDQNGNKSNNGIRRKVLFIGLDGATWKIIDPLIREGKLPNLQRLIKNGTSGPLESTETTISPSVWTTIFTGKAPEKHGIYNFMTMQNFLKARRLWTIFEDFGKSVGVGGFLMTWPPKVKHSQSFMIPDQFAPDSVTIPASASFFRELTSLRQFKDSLSFSKGFKFALSAKRHGISASDLAKAAHLFLWRKLTKPRYLDYFHREMTIFLLFMEKIFTFLSLQNRTDFSAVYFPNTDILAHKYWCYFQPEEFDDVAQEDIQKYGRVIPDQYMISDQAIGRIMKKFESVYGDFDTYVISDHGFQSCKRDKFVPNLNIEFLLEKIGLKDKFTYTKIGHSTFLNPIFNNNDSKDELIRECREKIESIRTIEKEIPIFETQLLEGNLKISAQPSWKGYEFSHSIKLNGEKLKVEDLMDKGLMLTGMHHRTGIFIMSGKNIKKNHKILNGTVFDVTPTILALNGMPVARDMDGKVLTEIAEDEFWENHPVEWVDSYGGPDDVVFNEKEMSSVKENEEELKRKLQSLGYMG